MKIKVCHLNVRSLLAHFADLKRFLEMNDFDIVTLSETWLKSSVDSNNVLIGGFSLVRRDRADSRGGGVAMYIKNSLKYVVLENSENLEDVWIALKLKNITVAIGCLYRPPNLNSIFFINEFETTLFNLLPRFDQTVCLGDFNFDLLDVNSPTNIRFSDLLAGAGLRQIVNFPTRTTLNSSTLLDLVILSDGLQYSACDFVHLPNISDHDLVHVTLSLDHQPCIVDPIVYRDYKNIDANQLYTDLQSIPWRNIFDIEAVEDKVGFLNDNLRVLLDLHAPYKTVVPNRVHKPWVTENVRLLMRERDRLFTKFKKNKNPRIFQEYKTIRNFTNRALEREKKAYMRHQMSRGSRELWSAVNKLNIYQKKPKPKIPDNLSNVNQINDFFVNSAPRIPPADNLNTVYSGTVPNLRSTLSFKTIEEDDIISHLYLIKSQSVGSDGLNITFVLMCCPFLIPYICHVVNCCIVQSVYPTQWKVSHVVPLPKVDNVQEYKDLRPISILPVFSKLLERAIKKQIVEHIEINNILPVVQSGFRKGHSCATALLNVTDYIFKATEAGKVSVLVLLDYTKAFDTINHSLLLLILKHIGLEGSAVAFFEGYLRERQQRVVLNGQISDVGFVDNGVPQGSILGPILYTVYTSFLTGVVSTCSTQMYADDTQLFFSFFPSEVAQGCEILNRDLKALYDNSLSHSLILNPIKTVALCFGPSKARSDVRDNINILVNDVPITLSNVSKNLGLWLDTELRFEKHISECIKKCIFKLKVLYSSRTILDLNLKLKLCESLILSVFNHCDVVYGPCLTASTSQKIQKIQNYCLRFAYGIRKHHPVVHKLKEAGWLSIRQRRTLHLAVLFHKIIILKKPPYLHSKIKFRTDVHNLNIRFKGTITPPIHRTSFFERSFSYTISAIYNAVPPQLKLKSVLSFRMAYKRYLLGS